MKKALLISLLLFFLGLSYAQSEKSSMIEQNAEIMAIDPQGNLYLVNDASLYKYGPEGELRYSYTNNILGNIASIDVDNPLKIMIFYRDAGIILFLNDKLAPIGDPIDIFAKGMTTISLATYSTKNNIILFDESNTDLIILDFYFQEKERIHYDFNEFHPFMLKDIHEKMLLMQDAKQGMFFFDGFGTFEKNIALYSDYPMQWLDNQFIYIKDKQLHSYNHQKFEDVIIHDLPDNVTQTILYRNKLFILADKKIKIIQLP